jgi:phosphoserine phosphatase RsbX
VEVMTSARQSQVIPGFVECGISARPIPGEIESGDLHLVVALTDGMLIAVIDGLGHGREAAAAARAAVDSLREAPHEALAVLMQRCHLALRNTRGAALSLAWIDGVRDQLTWVSVGNVAGTLVRADPLSTPNHETLAPRGGVIGHQIPPLRVNTLPIANGDMLVFATDGVSSRFHIDSPIAWCAQDLADHIVDCHGKETDDVLVVVARYIRGIPL